MHRFRPGNLRNHTTPPVSLPLGNVPGPPGRRVSIETNHPVSFHKPAQRGLYLQLRWYPPRAFRAVLLRPNTHFKQVLLQRRIPDKHRTIRDTSFTALRTIKPQRDRLPRPDFNGRVDYTTHIKFCKPGIRRSTHNIQEIGPHHFRVIRRIVEVLSDTTDRRPARLTRRIMYHTPARVIRRITIHIAQSLD